VSEEYPYAAKAKITTLIESLETLIKRDPEQENRLAVTSIGCWCSRSARTHPINSLTRGETETLLGAGEGYESWPNFTVAVPAIPVPDAVCGSTATAAEALSTT
jgi:hypothetical protein